MKSNSTSDPLVSIVAFVEGRMRGSELRELMRADPGPFERLLGAESAYPVPAYTGGSTFLEFLAMCGLGTPEGDLDAEGLLKWFLDHAGIAYRGTDQRNELFGLVLDAQPEWLDLDQAYLDDLIEVAGDRRGDELQGWLREEILLRFKFVTAPPVWLQSPEWPTGPAGPLVFLGQLPVAGYFHDDAVVYVFHDPDEGRIDTVVQVM